MEHGPDPADQPDTLCIHTPGDAVAHFLREPPSQACKRLREWGDKLNFVEAMVLRARGITEEQRQKMIDKLAGIETALAHATTIYGDRLTVTPAPAEGQAPLVCDVAANLWSIGTATQMRAMRTLYVQGREDFWRRIGAIAAQAPASEAEFAETFRRFQEAAAAYFHLNHSILRSFREPHVRDVLLPALHDEMETIMAHLRVLGLLGPTETLPYRNAVLLG